MRAGLSRDISLELANQTLLGAAKLSRVSGQHPAQLKDQVCSPAGSTIAGVASLEENAFEERSWMPFKLLTRGRRSWENKKIYQF